MERSENVFDQANFDSQKLTCSRCGWNGEGVDAKVADFYGIGKFKEVTCPECDARIGSIARERFYSQSGKKNPQGGSE